MPNRRDLSNPAGFARILAVTRTLILQLISLTAFKLKAHSAQTKVVVHHPVDGLPLVPTQAIPCGCELLAVVRGWGKSQARAADGAVSPVYLVVKVVMRVVAAVRLHDAIVSPAETVLEHLKATGDAKQFLALHDHHRVSEYKFFDERSHNLCPIFPFVPKAS